MSNVIETGNTFYEPICNKCEHWNIGTFSCAAFSRIPEIILTGENDHTEPLPNQKNDLVFKKKSNGL